MELTKQDVRRWVRYAIRVMLEGEKEESTGPDIKICFKEDEINYWASEIQVKTLSDGEWKVKDSFCLIRYYAGPWDMVTTPWINDLVNDISDSIMESTQNN